MSRRVSAQCPPPAHRSGSWSFGAPFRRRVAWRGSYHACASHSTLRGIARRITCVLSAPALGTLIPYRLRGSGVAEVTYVVVENCIKCKYMDCVEVCPVDCFYEGENMLVIHP